MISEKFKVGDKVRIIKYLGNFKNGRSDIGTVGTIRSITLYPVSYEVHVEGNFGWFYEEELELVKDDLRPCTVGDRNGKFHKWIEESRVVIKSNEMLRHDHLKRVEQFIDKNLIIPESYEFGIVTNTVALVEFNDGTVEKVKPEEVRFVVLED